MRRAAYPACAAIAVAFAFALGACTKKAPAPAEAVEAGATEPASVTVDAAAAPTPGDAIAAADSGEVDAGPVVPKACEDIFHKLGTVSFAADGDKLKITSSTTKVEGTCTRGKDDMLQCTWTNDGKPTGKFYVDVSPRRAIGGQYDKTNRFGCPPQPR